MKKTLHMYYVWYNTTTYKSCHYWKLPELKINYLVCVDYAFTNRQ